MSFKKYPIKIIIFIIAFFSSFVIVGNIAADSFDNDLAQAEKYFNYGKYKKAIFYYRKALDMRPKSSELHVILGVAYQYAGQYDEALKTFKEALELDPESGFACANLGYLYGLLGDQEAEKKISFKSKESVWRPRRV